VLFDSALCCRGFFLCEKGASSPTDARERRGRRRSQRKRCTERSIAGDTMRRPVLRETVDEIDTRGGDFFPSSVLATIKDRDEP